MRPFKLSPAFFIIFTAVTLAPAAWFARTLQDALVHFPLEFVQQLAAQRIVEAPGTVLIIGGIFWLYEKYLWRFAPIRALHGIPYVAGRYKGHLVSSYDNGSYDVVLEVRQTLTSVSICLYTQRSSSYSVLANIGKNGKENSCLAYVYKNAPRTVSNDLDMRAHDGFACLEIFEKERKLAGYYHNDPRERPTHGTLECVLESRDLQGHF